MPSDLTSGIIKVAAAKLFGGGRGVKKVSRSGLRYLDLPGGAIIIEQNPKKNGQWARLAQSGRHVAWVMKEGVYLARVIDSEVVLL